MEAGKEQNKSDASGAPTRPERDNGYILFPYDPLRSMREVSLYSTF